MITGRKLREEHGESLLLRLPLKILKKQYRLLTRKTKIKSAFRASVKEKLPLR